MTEAALQLVLAVALVGLGVFLRPYLGTKGKNLATREDIRAITEQVEEVRLIHARALEELKHQLSRHHVAFTEQYRAELDVYREIWHELTEVQRCTQQLRPMLDVGLDPGETKEDRMAQRLGDFGTAFNSFAAVVWRRRPFYPEEIHQELRKLSQIIHGEAIDYRHGDPVHDQNYWRKAQANMEEIGHQIERICVAIRRRLERVGGL